MYYVSTWANTNLTQVYTADETGLTKVSKSQSKVTLRARRQVVCFMSAEREEPSRAVFISAGGHYSPPLIIISRQRMEMYLLMELHMERWHLIIHVDGYKQKFLQSG
jgi:hypothetical protein